MMPRGQSAYFIGPRDQSGLEQDAMVSFLMTAHSSKHTERVRLQVQAPPDLGLSWRDQDSECPRGQSHRLPSYCFNPPSVTLLHQGNVLHEQANW